MLSKVLPSSRVLEFRPGGLNSHHTGLFHPSSSFSRRCISLPVGGSQLWDSGAALGVCPPALAPAHPAACAPAPS